MEKYQKPTYRVQKDATDKFLDYGKIPWTYFESKEDSPIESLIPQPIIPEHTTRVLKDVMDLL